MKTKSLAELKRTAKRGVLLAELVIRNGSTDIPEKLRGVRKIVDADSVGITFLNNENKRSELSIEAASLVEYTEDYLIIYNAGLRDLTDAEKAVFEKWKTVRDREQEERGAISDGSSSHWQQKKFFIDAGYEYLLGYEKKQGMKFDFNSRKVFDNKIKGDICMKYLFVKQAAAV